MSQLKLLLAVVFAAFIPVVAAPTASAVDVIKPVCDLTTKQPQVCKENENVKSSGGDPIFGPDGLLSTVINILSVLGAFIAVIVIFIGGAKMIVSSGDSESIASSRRTVLYAVISLAIIGTAQIGVRFLISKL